MKVLLIKNGDMMKSEVTGENLAVATMWITGDNESKSEIILSICSSELKQVEGCETSREVWFKF